MHETSLLLLRTQSAHRILKSLDESEQVKPVAAELSLIERILTRVIDAPDSLFEGVVMEVLDDTLQSALETIDNLTSEEDRS